VEVNVVERAQHGDRAALAALVDEFTPTVLGTAYGLCGDWHLAGDIAQEAFATVVTRIGDVREPAAFAGWLMAVVRTAARRQRPTTVSLPSADHVGTPAGGDGVTPGPEEIVVARDDARRVRRAVEELTPDLRLPMVLHYFAGCPLAEIAELCELPLSTVKKRMRVARTRLREGIEDMTTTIRPDAADDPSDVIRMYTAMRSGDVARVASILDVRPDLVDVREDWTRAESFAHRLPWTRGGGTPLLRAVERGDSVMVRLLLDRGADVDGSCTCDGGESPLWVAVVQRETAIVEELLRRGANPNAVAFTGLSALDIARRRGYDEIAAMLVAAGARTSAVAEARPVETPTGATGIKSIDLWCPLPERGLASLTPGLGIGAMVLIAELCHRAAKNGRRVVWTGFVQAPTDLGDIHHGLAESDIADIVTVSMAAPTAPEAEQVAALDRGIALAGDDALLVVFVETGHTSAVDERLPALARRDALTLVVSPLDGSVPAPKPTGSPYLASITFDVERAKRGRWPAISSGSWSKVADGDMAELAERARACTSDELDAYLSQPFAIAEPVTGEPGTSVSLDELRAQVSVLVEPTSSPAADVP
jgi:RNA polymerase sigma-70 factor (ECF subfamily)